MFVEAFFFEVWCKSGGPLSMISPLEFKDPIVFWPSSFIAFWIVQRFLLASTMQFEWRVCRKGASHSRVLGQSASKYWSNCGPEGNLRMLQTWFDAGPQGKQFFLTVSPMCAYKLQLEDITPLGMVFSRASGGKFEQHRQEVWFCRPKGMTKCFTVDLNFDEKPGEVKVTLLQLSGDSVHDAWYFGHIFQFNEFCSEAFWLSKHYLYLCMNGASKLLEGADSHFFF